MRRPLAPTIFAEARCRDRIEVPVLPSYLDRLDGAITGTVLERRRVTCGCLVTMKDIAFMKILVVIAHPRENSLTHQAASAFAEAAQANGHEVEFADLVAENFDPVLKAEDEPDWSGRDIDFAEDVRREMERVERNDATVLFFPVWWWSMPAILKGWIDRVWAQNWAFGSHTYPHAKVLMVGIAGAAENDYRKRGYDIALRTQLKVGILDYCSVKEGKVEILYGSLEGEAQAAAIISSAKDLGAKF